jgi:hypothetical protein
MKKLILTLAAIMALVGVMISPMTVMALDTTTIIGGVAIPTVTSIAPNSGVKGNTYTLVAIGGTYLTGASAVTFSGTDVTANTISVTSDTAITVTVLVGASAAIGARDVLVTTPGGTGTLTGGFTVVAGSITVNAPTGFSLGNMVRGTTVTGTAAAGSVVTDNPNWQVTALDSTTANPNKGYMTKAGTTPLIAKFQISRLSTTTGLANADTGITYDQTDNADKVLPFYVSQVINAAEAAGSYSITITFTGSTS